MRGVEYEQFYVGFAAMAGAVVLPSFYALYLVYKRNSWRCVLPLCALSCSSRTLLPQRRTKHTHAHANCAHISLNVLSLCVRCSFRRLTWSVFLVMVITEAFSAGAGAILFATTDSIATLWVCIFAPLFLVCACVERSRLASPHTHLSVAQLAFFTAMIEWPTNPAYWHYHQVGSLSHCFTSLFLVRCGRGDVNISIVLRTLSRPMITPRKLLDSI